MAHRNDVVLNGLQFGSYPSGPLDDRQAFGGGLHGVPVDQDGAQFLLEFGHVGRDVGLDGVEGASGRREAPVLDDGQQVAELAKVHR